MFIINAQIFSQNMAHFRKTQGYTIADISRLTMMPRSLVVSLESGSMPTNDQADRIARALGVKVEDLVLPLPPKDPHWESC